METKRDSYIDILKAIGIISIVIGHSSFVFPGSNFKIGPFVYTYHIMIFMKMLPKVRISMHSMLRIRLAFIN